MSDMFFGGGWSGGSSSGFFATTPQHNSASDIGCRLCVKLGKTNKKAVAIHDGDLVEINDRLRDTRIYEVTGVYDDCITSHPPTRHVRKSEIIAVYRRKGKHFKRIWTRKGGGGND